MPTANVTVGTAWALAVPEAATAFTLTGSQNSTPVFVATTAGDSTAPADGIVGHPLNEDFQMTRAMLPSGAVWARASRDGVIISVDAA